MTFDGRNLTETQHNCLELAEHIEQQPKEAFNMCEVWCGTAGCILGHALVMWGYQLPAYPQRSCDLQLAAEFVMPKLGLPNTSIFFSPRNKAGDRLGLWGVTQSMAVATLRRYALTGELDFDLEDR